MFCSATAAGSRRSLCQFTTSTRPSPPIAIPAATGCRGPSTPLPGLLANLPECHSRYRLCSDIVKSCADMGNLRGGEQVHTLLMKAGNPYRISIHNHLLKLYVKCARLNSAFNLLDEMSHRNIISWNTVICGFAGCFSSGGSVIIDGWVGSHPHGRDLGFSFLKRMMLEMVRPDQITFVGIFRICVELDRMLQGEQAHGLLVKLGYSSHRFVGSSVIDLYAKFGLADDARRAFDEISARDLVLWNVMISCYALNGLGREAFEVFRQMWLQGATGDAYTFSSLLDSVGSQDSIELGQQIHGYLTKAAPCFDVVLGCAIVDMYGKCRDMKSARRAFDLMGARNVVTWNSIIVNYVKSGDGEEPMKLLRQMLRKSLKPDELTLSSVLGSCAEQASASNVLQLHNYVLKSGLESFPTIGNSLVGAHAKCGYMHDALVAFGLIPRPDVVAWTAVISACAMHGLGKEALNFFEEMLCSGMKCFLSMVKEHKIKPNADHYTCVVDLLGKAGFLEDAYEFLRSLPFQNTASNLGAFLGACKLHDNEGLARWAAKLLFVLQPDEPVNYTLMSQIYAARGCWEGEQKVRNMMGRINGKKVRGCSWMETTSR